MSALWLFIAHALCVSAFNNVYARSGNTSTLLGTSASAGTTTLYAGNATVPATGTGLAYASACDAEKQSWYSEGGSTFASSTTFETTTSSISIDYPTYTETSTFLNYNNATPYTLCDGFLRIDGHTSTSTIISSITHTLTVSTFATSSAVYHNVSAPACSIQSSDCAALNSSWSSAYGAWYSYEEATATASTVLTTMTSPGNAQPPMCGSPALPSTTFEVGDPTCFENFASIQLLYWPVTKASGNLCDNNVSTMTLGPTVSGKPNTYVTWNTTLTSPTVYMAFDGTWVYTSAGSTYSDQSRLLLPQSSTAVSSLCGKVGGGYYPPEAVDYANFNYPVPASAYRCQPRCFINPLVFSYYNATNTYAGFTDSETTFTASTQTYEVASYNTYASDNLCSTIWDDYAPVLSIPQEFISLAPAGQIGGGLSCPFLFNSDAVFFDPPKALTQAASVIGPGSPGTTAATSTEWPTATAEPVSVPGPTTPRETSTPKPTVDPTTSRYSAVPETSSGLDSQSTQGDPMTSAVSNAAPVSTSTRGIGAVIASVLGMTKSSSAADASRTLVSDPAGPGSTAGQLSSDVVDPVSAQVTGALLTGSHGSVLTVTQPSSGGGLAVESVTLTYGQSTSISGIGNVVAGSSGIVVAGSTVPYSALAKAESAAQKVVTIGGQVLTASALSNGVILENAQTTVTALSDGAPITIGTQVISAADSGQLVDGSSTVTLSPGSASASDTPVFTFGGHTYTADSATDFDIGTGATLTPGGVVTVSGTTISLGPSGSVVVVDGTTQKLGSSLSSSASGTGPNSQGAGVSAATASSQSTGATSGAGRLTYGVGVALCFAIVFLVVA